MGYYAFLDDNNIVTEVIPGTDDLIDGELPHVWYGNYRNQKCLRTSYSAEGNGFRGYYAGIGYYYDETLDEFIPPPPIEPVEPA